MRVLVTGHHGYIGTLLADMLLRAGHDVVGLDSDLFLDSLFRGPIPSVPSIRKDLRDVSVADLDGFDAVAHLAAISNDPMGDLNPELTMEINHVASVRLAELAKEAGVQRFIFSSSCSTYGAASQTELLTEEAEFNPVTAYGKSKVLVERDVAKLADERFSPTFLRNTTAYGYSRFLRFDIVLNNFVAWAASTGKIFIKSDGTPWRPMVHVEDICRAFLAVLEAERSVVHNQAFNVGITEENYQIRDMAEIVRQTVPGCRVEYSSDGGPDLRCYRVDFTKIKRMLPKFQPVWDVRKGAEELYRVFKQVQLKLDDFEGPRYMRIRHLQKLMAEGTIGPDLRRADVPAHSVSVA
jgi:nucleoside-diphosphate-sugar epimerase